VPIDENTRDCDAIHTFRLSYLPPFAVKLRNPLQLCRHRLNVLTNSLNIPLHISGEILNIVRLYSFNKSIKDKPLIITSLLLAPKNNSQPIGLPINKFTLQQRPHNFPVLPHIKANIEALTPTQ